MAENTEKNTPKASDDSEKETLQVQTTTPEAREELAKAEEKRVEKENKEAAERTDVGIDGKNPVSFFNPSRKAFTSEAEADAYAAALKK